jgi:hypothetical protein
MKTDDLIGLLAKDVATTPERPLRALGRVMPLALAASLAGILVTLGVRADLLVAVQPTAIKWSLGLIMVAVGGWAALRLSRPETDAQAPLLALAAVPAAASLLILFSGGPAPFSVAAAKCLAALPLVAAPPLAATLFALARGAVTWPALAGGFAGLAAAGLAIPIYALHCTEDAGGFIGVWYVAAAGLTAIAGALAGRRALRW